MTRPRSQLIDLETTPYYHVISRCVRRAFLCGNDHYTGQNFDHRKAWVLERLKLLENMFCIDIAAFAIMSNHYHLVLHVDSQTLATLTDDDVIARWSMLYNKPLLQCKKERGEPLQPAEELMLQSQIATWRERLGSISWFMSCLNEHIAREANNEDNCTGRFWEGRFKSQALVDETALLSCMAYVDLNPVRAGIAGDTFSSEFTSIQQRLEEIKGQIDDAKPRLMPFVEFEHHQQVLQTLPHNLKDYCDLVDWTGRAARDDKRGYIHANKPALLTALSLSETQWTYLALEIQKRSINMLHGLEQINRSAFQDSA